jgi:hypothetical protein
MICILKLKLNNFIIKVNLDKLENKSEKLSFNLKKIYDVYNISFKNLLEKVIQKKELNPKFLEKAKKLLSRLKRVGN